MSIQPTPSPFETVPEELLVMIQEEVLIKSEPDEGSEQTADATSNFFHPSIWYREGGFPMLKNLRMACREYTYLPRLLSDLFKTIRLVSTPPNLRLHQMTDLSVFMSKQWHSIHGRTHPSSDSKSIPRNCNSRRRRFCGSFQTSVCHTEEWKSTLR